MCGLVVDGLVSLSVFLLCDGEGCGVCRAEDVEGLGLVQNLVVFPEGDVTNSELLGECVFLTSGGVFPYSE